ncbi:MAG: hypothetical protein ABI216_21980 [Devosia sp.]
MNDYPEASDVVVIANLRKRELVEKRTEPLEMTDSEIIDWVADRCEKHLYRMPTVMYEGGHEIYFDGGMAFAPIFRDAVCLAAAIVGELNS